MTMIETKRQNVIKQLTETIGEEAAAALMESIPPFDWHQIATKDDLANALQALTAEVSGQFAHVHGEIKRVEGELSIAIAEQTAVHSTQMQSLAEKHSTQMQYLAEKHSEQTAAHSTQMQYLAEKLAEQTAAHSTEMRNLAEKHSTEMAAMSDRISGKVDRAFYWAAGTLVALAVAVAGAVATGAVPF